VSRRSRVALTIDTEHPDHPAGAENPTLVLNALAAADARASFFVQGRWAAAHPALARRIAEQGHLIGNHSNSHAPMDMLTDDGIRDSVRKAEDAIKAAAGVSPRPWFRCPYGQGDDDPRVLDVLAGLGYRNIGWDVDHEDWRAGRTAAELIEGVAADVAEHGDGAVVLLHVWPDATAAALPEMIARLRAAGAEPVGLDELG
jgi:peptidoglycan/xylan/chitin deacetylase (PgdA/CDA1 family)